MGNAAWIGPWVQGPLASPSLPGLRGTLGGSCKQQLFRIRDRDINLTGSTVRQGVSLPMARSKSSSACPKGGPLPMAISKSPSATDRPGTGRGGELGCGWWREGQGRFPKQESNLSPGADRGQGRFPKQDSKLSPGVYRGHGHIQSKTTDVITDANGEFETRLKTRRW